MHLKSSTSRFRRFFAALAVILCLGLSAIVAWQASAISGVSASDAPTTVPAETASTDWGNVGAAAYVFSVDELIFPNASATPPRESVTGVPDGGLLANPERDLLPSEKLGLQTVPANVGRPSTDESYAPMSTSASVTFNFTGAVQTYTVPAGVTRIYVEAFGAGGGSGALGVNANGGNGGLGSRTAGELAVTPGQVINVFVGGSGGTPTAGFNGGGTGGSTNAGGGGGSSDVRFPGVAVADRLLVAGGGGGGGRGGCHENGATAAGNGGNGGVGPGATGTSGGNTATSGGVAGGGGPGNAGAVQGASGPAGIGCGGFLGAPGSSTATDVGGNGGGGQTCCCFSGNSTPGGGGGGGGFLGGGGGGGGSAGTAGCTGNSKGAGGGGGGGSSNTGAATSTSTAPGVQTGNGLVVITELGLTTTTITSDAPDPSTVGQAYNVAVSVVSTASTTVSYTGPAVAIPDGVGAGVNVNLPVSGVVGPVTDLNFRFDTVGVCDGTIGDTDCGVSHTWVGDLRFTLTPPDGAPTVTFIDRPGVPATGLGCANDNIAGATLNDDGGFPTIENICGGGPAIPAGNYSPNNPFSVFDGENANGTWILNVSDNQAFDTGTLRRFSLLFNTEAAPITGTVAVNDGTGETCTITLPATSCNLISTTAGAKTLTATYSGDALNNPSSDTEAHQVNKASTFTSIISDTPDPTVVGQPYTVTAGVVPTLTGTLSTADPTFTRPDVFNQGGACSTVGGARRYRAHPFTLTSSSNITASLVSADGASITPSGADTFLVLYGPGGFNPATPCANAIAANDDAVGLTSRIVTTTPLAAGNYTLVVTSFAPAPGDFPWSYTAVVIPSTAPRPVEVEDETRRNEKVAPAKVDPSLAEGYVPEDKVSVELPNAMDAVVPPSGSILISDGTNNCLITLPAVSCVMPSTSPGAKTLTATYSGDPNFNGSSSAPTTHTVNKANSNVTVLPSINPTTYGQTLTMTATMTAVAPGAGIPLGTVNFFDGATAIVGCQAVAVNAAGSATCTTAVLPAGNNKVIRADYSGDANFNLSTGSSLQTILKAALNVTASSHTVTYGDAVPAITPTYAGFVLGENAAALTTAPTCSTTYTATSGVAGSPYPTTCSGGVSNNYNFNYIGGQVLVNRKALTVTADNKTRGYGVANPALTATLSGFIAGDNAANSTTGSAALTTTATIASPVGSYPITVAIGSLASANYSFGTFTNGTLTITAAPLVVTADNKSRVFGAANPAFTFTVTGFTNGEGTSVLSGSPSMTTTATATSAPGNYPITITQNTLANSNYTFSFVNGTLTVSQAATTTVITNAAALAANATPVGQAYAVNWSVTPVAPGAGTPTGTVLVSDGANTCSAAVGTGTCSLTSTTVGAKTITAVYSGDANFAGSSATAATHTVVIAFTGNVKQFIAFGTNTNLAGVTMTLTNTTTNTSTTTTTDAGGNYSFGSLTLGQNYTITPSGLGKVYEATSRTYTNVNTNVAGGDFIAYDQPGPNAIPRSVRAVSQTVTAGSPVTVPILMTTTGVETRVAFSVEFAMGPLGIPSVSCGSGTPGCTVAFDNTQPGRYGITITPASAIAAGSREIARVTFPTSATTLTSTPVRFGDIPTAKNVRNSEGNPLPVLYWTDGTISFTGGTVLTGATITGRVTTPSGQGLRNATVVITDSTGNRMTAVTGSFGNYTFENLELGRDYTVTVQSRRYRFATRTVNLFDNVTTIDLIGLE